MIEKRVLRIEERKLAADEKILQGQPLDSSRVEMLQSIESLAYLYKKQGRADEAVPLFKRDITSREQLWGPDHEMLAGVLVDFADLDAARGDGTEAEPLYLRAIGIQRKAVAEAAERVAKKMWNEATVKNALWSQAQTVDKLADLYTAEGDLAAARQAYQQELALGEQAWGKDDPFASATREKLTSLERRLDSKAGDASHKSAGPQRNQPMR